MEVLALIPARSGSKSIRDKNIREIAGKPLMAHSIAHALASGQITRTIVSTDSARYAEIARQHGAETPFLRPAEFSTDTATDLQVFTHALGWLKSNENYMPDILVHLRPTYPIRLISDIDSMLSILINNPDIDSVRSVYKTEVVPHKMWYKNDSNILRPILADIPQAYNLPRQELPDIYWQNACIDVLRANTVTKKQSMSGDVIYGYEMRHFYDIDKEEEFQLVARIMRTK